MNTVEFIIRRTLRSIGIANERNYLRIASEQSQYLNEAEDISLATIAAIVEKMEEEGRSAGETAEAVEKQEKTLFTHIVIDSDSNPERLFAQACEDNDDVLFYIK